MANSIGCVKQKLALLGCVINLLKSKEPSSNKSWLVWRSPKILPLMQTTIDVNAHPRIVPCVNMWSVIFLSYFYSSSISSYATC